MTHSKISGQYDRTEIILDGLIEAGYDVRFCNMDNWKCNIFRVFVNIIKNYFWCDAYIIIASLNGVKVNLNILNILGIIRRKPVFQIAIGGMSNCEFVKTEKKYRDLVKKLQAVFVEIKSMINEYNHLGIDQVYYMPNCKAIDKDTRRKEPLLVEPYRFCTYSRVTPSKGIEEAIKAVERLNEEKGECYCTLDIYGTYLPEDSKWFEKLMSHASPAISYKNKIDRNESIVTLGQYDLMLFPTKHGGEGVPGAMIDCYEAGLPIVVCNTSFMSQIVIDEKSGFVYEGDNDLNLDKAILRYTESLTKDEKKQMRKNCMEMAMEYDTEKAISVLSNHLNNLK